jgi:Ca-activated chloride channel family protein
MIHAYLAFMNFLAMFYAIFTTFSVASLVLSGALAFSRSVARRSETKMTAPAIQRRTKLRIPKLLMWGLCVAVLGGLFSQPVFAQVDNDEVHIFSRSTLVRGSQPPAFKANVDLVLVNVTVTNSDNRLVSNLRASDFKILDGKHSQRIRYFSSEDAPISVAVILDTSRSMRNNFDEVRSAAMEFFRYSNPQDEFAVVAFADAPRLVADFTSSPEDIEAALQPIQAEGFTALWDAIYAGLTQMRKAHYGKKALLVISDGGDNHSRYTQGEIKSVLKEADVEVCAIDIFERFPKRPEEKSGLLALDEVVSVTGGRVFLTHDANELHRAVKQISDELRTQYVLGYLPGQSARDGKWHKVKVELNVAKAKKLRVHAKKGYYGPVDR